MKDRVKLNCEALKMIATRRSRSRWRMHSRIHFKDLRNFGILEKSERIRSTIEHKYEDSFIIGMKDLFVIYINYWSRG
jgi:hypothetical protein